MSPAAALLRSIEPLSVYPLSLKAVYPLLAGLVEAVAFAERESRVDPRVALLPYGVSKALAALEAAAAKEGV